jgi:nitrate/nitrite transporter NarK
LETYAPPELQNHDKVSLVAIFESVRSVFSFKNTWLILIAQGGMVGPIMTFTGLWGAPFLKARFGLEPKSAATICSIMIVCWAVASPIFGAFSDKIRKRKPAYLLGSLACTAGWAVMIYVTSLPLSVFTVVAALTSFATGCVVIAFAYARESVPAQHMGTVTATTNIGNMLGNVLLQPGIGLLLDRHWTGEIAKGARVYGVEAYQAGFILILGWSLLSCIVIALTTETNCQQNR